MRRRSAPSSKQIHKPKFEKERIPKIDLKCNQLITPNPDVWTPESIKYFTGVCTNPKLTRNSN